MSKRDFKRTTVDIPLDVSEELESLVGRFDKSYRSKQEFILDAIIEKLSRESAKESKREESLK